MNEIELVERYLGVMADHLPKKEREEVVNEMRSNILDMLPDDPTQNDVRNVLEKLGDPLALANEYLKDKKYMLGFSVYNSYFAVLKIAVGVTAIVFAFLSLLGILLGRPDPSMGLPAGKVVSFSVDIIIEILSSAFQGALVSFVWVTAVFITMDRAGVNQAGPFRRKSWTIERLPQPSSDEKGRISRAETAVGLIGSIFFTALLLKGPGLIGWYENVDGVITAKASLFNIEQLNFYAFTIVIFAGIQFILSVYKFIVKRWNLPMAIFNALNNIAVCIFVSVISKDPLIVNPGFVSLFSDKAGWTAESAMLAYQSFMTGFLVFFILISAIDSISGFIKSRRLKLPSFIH